MGTFLPRRPPQPTSALGTALVLPYFAKPVGQPYLLHGHVIRENFIVKKELHLGRRQGPSFRNYSLAQVKNYPSLPLTLFLLSSPFPSPQKKIYMGILTCWGFSIKR